MNMPESLPSPLWIDTPGDFQSLVAELSTQARIAVDTESNSLHAYREQVCLIQFSSPAADYIVDPFALDDMSPLAPLFANPDIQKLFHAAEYDLICLRRDFGFTFANLFDTMQAARILGYPAVGLDKLLGDKFGIVVDKRLQKADWASRPLTTEQIHYARLDTHYLFDLRDVLERELCEKGRWRLAQEDFQRACLADVSKKERRDSDPWARFAGRKDISARELTILGELSMWRESMAEKMNRPPFKVLGDDMLIEVARNEPSHLVDLSGIGLSERQIKLWGEGLLVAVGRGSEAPLLKRRQAKRPDDAVTKRLEKLKNWRKKAAMEMGVESDIVLPRPYLYVLAENPPRNLDELAVMMGESPSRVEQYGSQILKLLGG